MKTSDSVAKIFPALIAAQGEVEMVWKREENPYHQSKYADLPAIQAAANPVLARHELSIVQSPGQATMMSENIICLTLVTRLIHVSGEWMEQEQHIPMAKADPQGAGSAITYGRRYAIAALLNMTVDKDDDAEGAMGRARASQVKPAATASVKADGSPFNLDAWGAMLENASSLVALQNLAAKAQTELTRAQRDLLLHTFNEAQDRLRDVRRSELMEAATEARGAPDEAFNHAPTQSMTGKNPPRSDIVITSGVPHCAKHSRYPMKSKTGETKGQSWTRFWCSAKDPSGPKGFCTTNAFADQLPT